jgi:hypothetical protein
MPLKLEITVDTPEELAATLRNLGAQFGVVVATAAQATDAPKAPAKAARVAPDAPSLAAAAPAPSVTSQAEQPATPTQAAAAPVAAPTPPATTPAAPAASTGAAPTIADFQAAMKACMTAKSAGKVQQVLKETAGTPAPAQVKPEQYAAVIAALNAAAAAA